MAWQAKSLEMLPSSDELCEALGQVTLSEGHCIRLCPFALMALLMLVQAAGVYDCLSQTHINAVRCKPS